MDALSDGRLGRGEAMALDRIATVCSLLPRYILSIADLHALSLTSRDLRQAVLAHLTPRSLYAILYRSAETVFPLQPDHTLLGLIGKGFARWLGESASNREVFKRASIRGVTPSYLVLALETDIPGYAHLDLAFVRDVVVKRNAMAVGLADLLDVCVGKQWYDVEDYWDGGRIDARTLYADPDEMVYLWANYGELFGHAVESWYASLVSRQAGQGAVDRVEPGGVGGKGRKGSVGGVGGVIPPEARGTELSVRLEWVKYSMPDWHTAYETRRGNQPWGWESDYPASLDDLHEESPADDGTQRDDQGDGADAGSDHVAQDEDTSAQDVDPPPHPGSLREDDPSVPSVPHISDPLIPPHSDPLVPPDTNSDPSDTTDDENDIHSPSVHPLRAVRRVGAYADPHALGRMEHPTCMLHLFEKSALFNRLTRRIRLRVARLARSPARLDGGASTSADPAETQDDEHGDDVHEHEGRGDGGRGDDEQSDNKDGDDEQGDNEDRSDEDGDDDLEFGKTVYQCGEEDFPTWKQLLWEDALYTAGWDGLELVADEWEWDAENWKAAQRRNRREAGDTTGRGQRLTKGDPVSPSDVSTTLAPKVSAGITTSQDLQQRVTDDHAGLQRLVRVYRYLAALTDEPDRVALRSIERPDRPPVETYLVPFMLGDMRLAIWNSRMGQSWRIKR